MPVATALTVYGIETQLVRHFGMLFEVATALTVYGIETSAIRIRPNKIMNMLQQHLPFTVLKLVLFPYITPYNPVATALTVYGIETAVYRH